MAPILGEQISHVQDINSLAEQLLDSRIEPLHTDSTCFDNLPSSTVKALALMENIDTSYLFVIDEGSYQGVVTL